MNLYSIRKELNMGVVLTNMNLRVTYYSRVSTDHFEQQNSLKNQIDYFDEMIKNNKNWIYIPGYVDDGISGTQDYKRNAFLKMIDDAKKNKFDLIITKEISRFSRNTLDSIKYTRELLTYGVAVLFISDNINTALPDSELRLTIMASLAQDEIRKLSERVKFGMNRSIKSGNILGNDMHYGYKKSKTTGNLIVVEEEAEIIKRLYKMYAIDNLSLSQIAKTFNAENIKTSRNKEWCISTLSRMIKNPKYKGYYCGKKTEVIDYMTKKVILLPEKDWIMYKDSKKIPAIVTEELWQRANDRLLLRKRSFGDDYKESKIIYQSRYPFSAKLYCSTHNKVFHRRKQCKASDDITWTCSEYLKYGKKHCNSPNIRESELYTMFNDIIEYLKIDLNMVSNILLDFYLNNINIDTNYEIDKLKKEKDKLFIKKDRLLELNIAGSISNDEFNKKNNSYNSDMNKLEKDLLLLKKRKKEALLNNNTLKKILKAKIMNETIYEKLLNMLLDKIIVSKINDNKEDIKLKFYLKDYSKIKNLKMQKTYKFKRGYNTTGTRRYEIKYHVILMSG